MPRRHDVIARLHAAGHLTDAQRRAADEIHAILQALSLGLDARARDPSALPGGSATRQAVSHERMSDTMFDLYRRVYRPWAEEMRSSILLSRGKRGPTRLRLVLDIVVCNIGVREAEDMNRLRHGSARAELASALTRYDAIRDRFFADTEQKRFITGTFA